MCRQKKSPAVGSGAIPNNNRGTTTISSLPTRADSRTLAPATLSTVLAEAGGDISRLHPRAVEVFHDGYVSGHLEGWRAGYVARAQEEAAEWIPVRDHVNAYVRSVHGLTERRSSHVYPEAKTPQQIKADAYRSWGIPFEEAS